MISVVSTDHEFRQIQISTPQFPAQFPVDLSTDLLDDGIDFVALTKSLFENNLGWYGIPAVNQDRLERSGVVDCGSGGMEGEKRF